METVHILLVSPNAYDASLIRDLLAEDKDSLLRYHLDVESESNEALRALVRNTHDVYLLDQVITNSRNSVADFLKQANAGGCQSPVILMTVARDCDIDWVVEECGAAGYINKHQDFNERVLRHAIRYAIRHFKHLQEIREQLSYVQQQLSEVNRKLGHRG